MIRSFIGMVLLWFFSTLGGLGIHGQTAALPGLADPAQDDQAAAPTPKGPVDVNVPSSAIGVQETWQEEAKRKEINLYTHEHKTTKRLSISTIGNTLLQYTLFGIQLSVGSLILRQWRNNSMLQKVDRQIKSQVKLIKKTKTQAIWNSR